MAAIQWDRYEELDRRVRRRPLRVVTAPPSRRRPDAATYRRRRLLAAVLALSVVLGALQLGRPFLTASGAAGSTPSAPVVLVAQPGDSYWTLARAVHDGGDLRSTVDALVDANGHRDLQAGDRIVLDR